MALNGPGISSIKESKQIVCTDPVQSITGTKRIPDLKSLEDMPVSDLSSLKIESVHYEEASMGGVIDLKMTLTDG